MSCAENIVPDNLTRLGEVNDRKFHALRRAFRFFYGSDPHPTTEQLQEVRDFICAGDPLADAVVAMYRELPPGQGRKMLDQALEQGIHTVANPPPALVALFDQVDRVPLWLNREQLNLASDVSRRVGPSAELVLRNLSLMGGYLGAAAAKPLVMTGQLERMTPRRLVETSKFWIEATARDGLERYSDGFKSAVRVRMMHAQVRAMLLQSDKWKPGWGHPLNQWDSMATLLEFSSILLTGLRLLGFVFTRREREAVVHQWRYIGYLMGVDQRIVPASEADSMKALYTVVLTAPEPDEDSRALGQSLMEVPVQFAGEGAWAQRVARVERLLRVGYSRYALGDKSGDALGLPRTLAKYFWPAQAPLRLVTEVVRMSLPPLNRWMVRRGEAALMKEFQRRVTLTRPDTSFTPVQKLAR